MMRKNRINFILVLSFFIAVIVAANNFLTVDAVPTTSQVYQDAPDGLKLDGLIDIPSTYDDGTGDDAKLKTDFPVNIVQMLSSATDGGSTTQVSSFWGKHSNDSTTDNYFDLTQPQVISAWIYFGDTYHDYPSSTGGDKNKAYAFQGEKTNAAEVAAWKDSFASDGLALVLQNDDRGAKAISGAVSKPVNNYYQTSGGQSLGVWGTATTNGSVFSSSGEYNSAYNILNKGGIQNSFAVEFDTVNNYEKSSVAGKDDSLDFDNDVKGQHMAYAYPGDSSTYSQTYKTTGLFLKTTTYENLMTHMQGPTGNNIEMSGYADGVSKTANNAWKHITFAYQPPASKDSTEGTFTIAFNDQERDGSAKPIYESNILTNRAINISAFKSSNYRVRWGFTAATGSQFSKPRTYSVILQRMPNVANLDSKTSLTDMSQYNDSGTKGRKISDLYQDGGYNPNGGISSFLKSPDYNVANGDLLKFNYDMSYLSGTIGTGPITTSIELPKNVDFDSGLNSDFGADSIGKVTYSGTGSKADQSFEIPASSITTDANGNKSIKLQMDSIDTIGMKVSIELYGKADNSSTKPVLVTSEPASIRSDSYIEDLSSPAFIINDQLQIATNDFLNQEVEYTQAPSKLTGTLNYVNKSKVDSNTQFYTKINNNAAVAANGQMTISDDGLSGSYSIDAPSAASVSNGQLHVGKNTIEVYAVDSIKRVSNVITYTINVKDFANLILSSDNLDQTIDLSETAKLGVTVKYDNNGSLQNMPLTTHWNIDGKDQTPGNLNVKDPQTSYEFFEYKSGKELGVGKHKITLYLNDGSRNSNTITFNITVNDRTLIATADPDTESITVNDNNPVNIKGSFKFSDDSALSATSEVTYTIKNEGQDPQAPVKTNASDGKIDLTLNPILESKINQTDLVDKAINNPTTPGLREGRNEVTVTVKDSGLTSNSLTYVINVPKMTPKLTTDELDVQAKKVGNIPIEFTYDYGDNSEYKLKPSGLLYFYKNNTASQWVRFNLSGDEKSTPYTFNTYLAGNNIGITSKEPYEHKADILTYDPYGRKSNSLTYNITYIPKSLSLTVKNNYQFKDIKFGETTSADKTLERKNTWDIEVDSYKSKWKLMAQQTAEFKTKDGDKMAAYLNFQDKNKNAYSLSNPTEIAADDTAPTTEEITNVGQEWGADDGILITINSYPAAGLYQSQITWTLVDSDVV